MHDRKKFCSEEDPAITALHEAATRHEVGYVLLVYDNKGISVCANTDDKALIAGVCRQTAVQEMQLLAKEAN